MKIHWARVVSAALLLEAALFAILTAIFLMFGTRVLLIATPIACFLLALVLTTWSVRSIQSRVLLHDPDGCRS